MIGLFAGWAAYFCSGLMAFAYWMAHGTQAFLPIQNMGELAALYCFVFLYISSHGSGMWSVDAARKTTQLPPRKRCYTWRVDVPIDSPVRDGCLEYLAGQRP